MPFRPELSFTDSLQSDQRRNFYERHQSIAILMILIVFLAPFRGTLCYWVVRSGNWCGSFGGLLLPDAVHLAQTL